MGIESLLGKLKAQGDSQAIVFAGRSYSYNDIEKKRLEWLAYLRSKRISRKEVVGIQTDHSVDGIALLLAIWSTGGIAALLPRAPGQEDFHQDAQIGAICRLRIDKPAEWTQTSHKARHPLILSLRERNSPGVIIFSSGASGRPKAILHDVERLLRKFEYAKKRFRTMAFLLFDHIAGLDTLLYTLSSGGVLVIPMRRDPSYICRLVQDHRVEVLPASPTFLNLLCVSGQYEKYDLSSLKVITYGSEPMNQTTLNRLREIFPNTRLIQKYGTSEFGSPRSMSKGNDSLWLKLHSDDLETKIVDNALWVKSPAAMLGYLNAPNPINEDGWFPTGDEVVVDGEWVQIIGRKSEVIIVGGEKVYPAEIESVILQVQDVMDVVVRGEQFVLTGQIVSASVQVRDGNEEPKEIIKEIRKHCRSKLEPYKVPMKIEITEKPLGSPRQKKLHSCRV